MENEKNRVIGGGYSQQWIATLRGFAALLVFISHLGIELPLEIMFMLGRVGVVIFFLMMGYLALDSRKKRNAKQYLFNRFVRMYPVYWILLILNFFIHREYSFRDLIANFTLFQEFMGVECIIGPSWMMCIQVCFFITLALLGADFFISDKKLGKFQYSDMLFIVVGIGAVLCSILRYMKNIPLPTALFLLYMIGLIGIDYNKDKTIKRQLIYFEIILMISTVLSYPDKCIAYMISYNVGIFVFVVADKKDIYVKPLVNLGKVGFTFFLSGGILYGIACKFVDFSQTANMIILGCIVKFVVTLFFACVVTRFVEAPLLSRCKDIEKQLK